MKCNLLKERWTQFLISIEKTISTVEQIYSFISHLNYFPFNFSNDDS